MASAYLMVVASCGFKSEISKERTPAPELAELSLFTEGTCDHSSSENLTNDHPLKKSESLKNKVQSLANKAASFSLRYNQQHFPHLLAPQDIDVNSAFFTDPLNPLILSQKRLEKSLNELGSKWREAVGENNLAIFASMQSGQQQDVKPLQKIESVEEIKSIHRELHILKRKAERFHALSCSYPTLKARAENDVRAYFVTKDRLDSGFSAGDPSMEAFLLSMCTEFNTEALCSLEYLMIKRQGRQNLFHQNYARHFEKRLSHFFEPHEATKWKCHKEEGQTVVTVKLLEDQRLKNQLFGTYEVLKSFVAQKWSNESARVELEVLKPTQLEDGEKAIKIVWTPHALSFVSRNEPYIINLSSKLNFSQLSLTFAHELGHVLGFPDCYHEFYDQKTKEIIYYTLDKTGKNLMCHLNGKASMPDSYLDQLSSQVCK
jgi:hypothetical protein